MRLSSALPEGKSTNLDTGRYIEHRTPLKVRIQKFLHRQIDFVPQLDRKQPQLLFPVVPARIVVQALKETTDRLDENMSEDGEGGLCASQFEDHDMDQLLALHHTTLRIRSDIKASPSNNDCTSINADNAAKLVPESIFTLLSVRLTEEHGDADVDKIMQMLSLSIEQDIGHAVSKVKVHTTKHVGLGMTIYQATRSKELLNSSTRPGTV